jgi:hypothetical protein
LLGLSSLPICDDLAITQLATSGAGNIVGRALFGHGVGAVGVTSASLSRLQRLTRVAA